MQAVPLKRTCIKTQTHKRKEKFRSGYKSTLQRKYLKLTQPNEDKSFHYCRTCTSNSF